MSPGNQDPKRLLAAAAALDAELAALPRLDAGGDWEARIRAARDYHAALDDLPARLAARMDWPPDTCVQATDGGRFALMGLRASSPCGLAGAIRNWIAQARARAGVGL